MSAREPHVATSCQGVEPELAHDLLTLGATNIREDVGKVFFEASREESLGIIHGLRAGDKVLRVVQTGEVASAADVRMLGLSTDWPSVFPSSKSFAVRAQRLGEHSFTSLDCAKEMGAAIIECFEAMGHERPRVRLNGPEVEVRVIVRDEYCTLAVNLSGASHHKRGWRAVGHMAPMKPTLAAALVTFSGWERLGFGPLLDPTCGSGTIPIEAALLARRTPPGMFRLDRGRETARQPGKRKRMRADPESRNGRGREAAGLPADPDNAEDAWFQETHTPTGYLFHHLHGYDDAMWTEARHRMEARADATRALDIVGSDRSENEIDGAERNAAAAGVDDAITFRVADVTGFSPDVHPRVIVANPPYGVRIGSQQLVDKVNRGIADLVDREVKRGPLTVALVAGDLRLERAIDHAFVEKRRVLFGNLPVHFLRWDLE